MADNMLFTVIICFIAGVGAGLGTGFAGLSAAVVITPLLVAFLDIDFYVATAIALASDVLASLISAIVYGTKKNIDFKNAIVMMIFVILFTVVGSFVANFVNKAVNNRDIMNLFPVVITMAMGLKFILKPIKTTKESQKEKSKRRRFIESMLCGIYIGFLAGFAGAGGGMMLLFALTILLKYELKTAVGTSVLIMSLTAFTGAMTHFITIAADSTMSVRWEVLIMCIIFTFIFANIGSLIANHVSNITLNRTTGIILITSSLSVLFVTYLWPLMYNQPEAIATIVETELLRYKSYIPILRI